MADNQANAGMFQNMKEETPEKKEKKKTGKEKLYQKILMLDKSVKCIEQYELFEFVYKDIIKKAKKLEGYKDADVYKEKYEKQLKKLQIEAREEIYQNAVKLKENAKMAEDLQWVRKEIQRIPDYKDVDEISRWCDLMQNRMEKREKRNAWIRISIIILVICILIFAKYAWGNLR